jgi:hypothetical protein
MRVLSRAVILVLGFVALFVGIVQLIRPRLVWLAAEPFITWARSAGPPVAFYAVGAILLILGGILVYAGVRRFTPYSALIWVVGLLYLVFGFFVLIAPAAFRDSAVAIFYGKPESTKILLSYIGGVIRIIIGILFIKAGLAHSVPRHRLQASPTG